MAEIRGLRSGMQTAQSSTLRIPVLILLLSACVGMELEPIAAAGVMLFAAKSSAGTALVDNSRSCLIRADLTTVQIELMRVMRTDSARTASLEQREKELKYALRSEEIRRDESAQRRDWKRSGGPALAQRSGSGTPRS